MQNVIAFINQWLSYFLVYVIFGVAAVAAVMIGKGLREKQDAKN
jgi:hypothetical protein